MEITERIRKLIRKEVNMGTEPLEILEMIMDICNEVSHGDN